MKDELLKLKEQLRAEIEARLRAEEKLKKQAWSQLEVKLKEVARFPMENPDPVFRYDNNFKVIFKNPAAEFLLEKLKAYPEQNYSLLINLKRSLYKDVNLTFEVSFPDHKYTLTIVSMEDRGYINVYGNDITDRKKMEADLLKSESRLQAFLDSVPDMMFRINKEGIFLDIKSGVTKVLQPDKSPEEIVGSSLKDTAISDDVKEELFSAIRETIDTGKVNVLEYGLDYKGDDVFFETRIVKSGPDEAITTVRDITPKKKLDLKLEEQKQFYESILNNMPSDIVVFDKDHRYLFINPIAIKDKETREWLIGKTDFDYCNRRGMPDTLAKARRALFDKVKEDKMNFAMEEKVAGKEGKEEWHYRRMMPIMTDSNNQPAYILGYGLDITELKETQFELEEAKELAERSVESKQQFLANMSHEIRTPMNAVLGMAKLLSQTGLTGKQLEYLKAITDSSDHLLTVINDILDFSKIDSGKIELEESAFDLKELTSSTIRSLQLKARENEDSLSLEFDDNIYATIKGDKYRLKQVLINLLNNAIKFTNKGKVILSCLLLSEIQGKQTIRIKVSDTGIGIDADKMDKIFEGFIQEDGSITRKYGGTGLGLTISKNLVELMGGNLEVCSDKGVGTQFYFDLTFEKDTSLSVNEKKFEPLNYDFSDVRLLMAEDNQFNQLFVTEILRQYGFDFSMASNGEEVVEVARNKTFDIGFLDIQMPLMSGLDACHILKNDLKVDYPLVALTANALKGDRENFISRGFDDYMSKPFNEHDLLRLIVDLLGLKEVGEAGLARKESRKEESTQQQNVLYDFEKLLRMTNGDKAFADKMLQDFYRLTPDLLTKLAASLEQEDAEAVQETAHKMKSSYGIMADESLYDKLVHIEKSLKANGSLGNVKSQVRQVLSLSNVMLQQIEEKQHVLPK